MEKQLNNSVRRQGELITCGRRSAVFSSNQDELHNIISHRPAILHPEASSSQPYVNHQSPDQFSDSSNSSTRFHRNPDGMNCTRSRLSGRRHRHTSDSIESISSFDSTEERDTDLKAKFPMEMLNVNEPDSQIGNKNIIEENKKPEMVYISNFRPIRPMPNNSNEPLQEKYSKVSDSSFFRNDARSTSTLSNNSLRSQPNSRLSYSQVDITKEYVKAGSSKCNTMMEDLRHNNNNYSPVYFVSTPPETSNTSQLNKQGINRSKDGVVDKSNRLPLGTSIVIQPKPNVYYKMRKNNARNIYSVVNAPIPFNKNSGSGYESDVSEYDHQTNQVEQLVNTSNYVQNINKHPYSSIAAPKVSSTSQGTHAVQMLPIHSGRRSIHSSYKAKEFLNSLSSFELSENESPLPHSLSLKQRELAEKAEQLRIVEEFVKQQEEEAQLKTWQALKEQEAALREKEESLKYREIVAQKKYKEATRLLEESRKLTEYERTKDNNQPIHIRSKSFQSTPLSLKLSVSDKSQIQYGIPIDLNTDMTNSPTLYMTPLSSDISISDSQRHFALQKSQSKPISKVTTRKSKKKIISLDICEVKPSIEPTKIVHTYSRKSTRRHSIQSKVDLEGLDSSFNHSQNTSVTTETDAIDVPVSTRDLKEQVLVNESGTITITQLPKFDQPIRPYKCLSHLHSLSDKPREESFQPINSVRSYSLKKCPSRIETDSSPYSSSSDISVAFTEKVEKLTSSTTNIQFYSQTLGANSNTEKTILEPNSDLKNIAPTISSKDSDSTHYLVEDSLNKINSGDENTYKNRKGRISDVTLQDVSFPSKSDVTAPTHTQLLKHNGLRYSLVTYGNSQPSGNFVKLQTNSDIGMSGITQSCKVKECRSTADNILFNSKSIIVKPSPITPSIPVRKESYSETNLNDDNVNQPDTETVCTSSPRNLLENESRPHFTINNQNLARTFNPLEYKTDIPQTLNASEQSLSEHDFSSRTTTLIRTPDISSVPLKENYNLGISGQKVQLPQYYISNNVDSVSPTMVKSLDHCKYILETTEGTQEISPTTSEHTRLSTVIDHNPQTYLVTKKERITETKFSPSKSLVSDEMNKNEQIHSGENNDNDVELAVNVSEKVDNKENILLYSNSLKGSIVDDANGVLVSSVCSNLNKHIPVFINKNINSENLNFVNVNKTSGLDENIQQTLNKLNTYQSSQMNNVQKIIVDKNYTESSIFPDKSITAGNIKNEGNLPTNVQVISSASIHYDPRLLQYILSSPGQIIYYSPSNIITTQPENLDSTYGTNAISSYPSTLNNNECSQAILPDTLGESTKINAEIQTEAFNDNLEGDTSLNENLSTDQAEEQRTYTELTAHVEQISTEDASNISNQITEYLNRNQNQELSLGEVNESILPTTNSVKTKQECAPELSHLDCRENLVENNEDFEQNLDESHEDFVESDLNVCEDFEQNDLTVCENSENYHNFEEIVQNVCANREDFGENDQNVCENNEIQNEKKFDSMYNAITKIENTTENYECMNKITSKTSTRGRVLVTKKRWPDVVTDTESSKTSPELDNDNFCVKQRTSESEEVQRVVDSPPTTIKKKRGRPKLNKVSTVQQSTESDKVQEPTLDSDSVVMTKKKRGRPRRKGKKRKIASKNHEKKDCPDSDVIWETICVPLMPKENSPVECGRCNIVLPSVKNFKSHAFEIHSGLVRIKGQSQEFDSKTTYKVLTIVLEKQKVLHCDVCSKDYISVLGFKKHHEVCGKTYEDVHTTCHICSKDIVKTMIERHISNHGIAASNSMPLESSFTDINNHRKRLREETDLVENDERRKRRAAKSCHDQMKLLYSSIDAENDDSNDKDFETENNNFSRFYNSSSNSKTPDKSSAFENFKENIREHGESSCINVNCNASFKSLKKLKLHLKMCVESKVFTCKFCNCTLKESEMGIHMERNHGDSLSVHSESSSDDELSLMDAEINQEKFKRSHVLHSKPYLLAKTMTVEFRKNNYSDNLFTELHCFTSAWEEIRDYSEVNLYMPKLESSPFFKYQNNSSKSQPDSWDKMETFSGKKLGSGEILFAGGPIRASAWCPIPIMNKSCLQYIALSCVSDPDQVFPINKSEKHNGLIQIWNCGTLLQPEAPILSLSIAHNSGVVWSLEWCPSGIYENAENNNLSETTRMNRLGLLSAAFSDGTIGVYLIPHPHQLKSDTKIFKKTPDLCLCPYDYENVELQCLDVSWSSSKGHSLIAGSFTNGMVCVWDVTNTSLLLNCEDPSGKNILYPINSIPAHNGVCSTVSFSPKTNGQHIVTGGSDRTIKFWDLTQPEHPLTMIRKGIVTGSVWLPHWAGSFISFDDVFSLGKTSTTFRENGFYGGTYRAIMGTNSTVWSIAGSDWLNAIAQVDESGEIIVSSQHSLSCHTATEKHMAKKRCPIFSVRLENLKDRKILSLQEEYRSKTASLKQDCSPTIHTNVELNPEKFVEHPLTYSSTADLYGVRLLDAEYKDFSKLDEEVIRSKQVSELMEPGPLTIYPLMGASSVSWNNNLGSHTWIFVGLNSGFGRIIKLSFLERR